MGSEKQPRYICSFSLTWKIWDRKEKKMDGGSDEGSPAKLAAVLFKGTHCFHYVTKQRKNKEIGNSLLVTQSP